MLARVCRQVTVRRPTHPAEALDPTEAPTSLSRGSANAMETLTAAAVPPAMDGTKEPSAVQDTEASSTEACSAQPGTQWDPCQAFGQDGIPTARCLSPPDNSDAQESDSAQAPTPADGEPRGPGTGNLATEQMHERRKSRCSSSGSSRCSSNSPPPSRADTTPPEQTRLEVRESAFIIHLMRFLRWPSAYICACMYSKVPKCILSFLCSFVGTK